MCEVLNQASEDEDNGSKLTPKSNSPGFAKSGQSDYVICAPNVLNNMVNVLKHPSRTQVHTLYLSYMTNEESAMKILDLLSFLIRCQ